MDHDVLIVGAGPTGLAAALFLAHRGVSVRLVDRAPQPNSTSRAMVVNPRSLELLQFTGVTDAIRSESRTIRGVRFYSDWHPLASLDFGDLPSPYAMSVIPQARTEALLTDALAGFGVAPERGLALDRMELDGPQVHATLADCDGRQGPFTTRLMLGADGAHSTVRDLLGIPFEGHAFPEAWPLWDLQMEDPLDLDYAHVSFVSGGMVFMLALRPGLWRAFGDCEDLPAHLPPGVEPAATVWQSSFHISDRVAQTIHWGPVALAGDAAHIHSPVGARGMNLGIEDAYAYAACAVDALGGNLERISDYGRSRHRVHTEVVDRMDKLTRLARGRPAWVALLRRILIPSLVAVDPLTHSMRDFVTGLDHPAPV